MKIRDLVFLVIGGLLVISGMVLNSVLITDADAQSGGLDMNFGEITCSDISIVDKNGKPRGGFGLSTNGDAMLEIYGDDGKSKVAYLGRNATEGEMMLRLESKSKTDKREASMTIDKNGGRFDGGNKMGEDVATIGVGSDGSGVLDLRDKYGYKK